MNFAITTNLIVNLIVMAGVTYLIRAVPIVLCRKKIENRFIRSFLYYIPYAVLTVMTVPAIFTAMGNDHILPAVIGFAVALIVAFFDKGLLTVAVSACASAFIASLFL